AGDVEIRQTLEKHFLDGVALSLNLTRDLGIQRPAVVGQTAQDFEECFADLLFPALRLGNGVDLVNRPLPLLKLPLRDLIHPAEKGVSNGLLRRKGVGNEKRCAQQGDVRQFHGTLPRIGVAAVCWTPEKLALAAAPMSRRALSSH